MLETIAQIVVTIALVGIILKYLYDSLRGP